MVFKKIIFQNSLMANETPSRPSPPFMANAILNFHFDFLHPSLSGLNPIKHSTFIFYIPLDQGDQDPVTPPSSLVLVAAAW